MDARPSVAGVSRSGFIRDPSGLLMSIIRTLAASGDEHHKEQEKERLEEAFGRSDEKLDELVARNYEELAKTIKQFGKIGDRISDSRSRIKKVKENLQHCKSLLHCRQDELRKLWVEGVEHKRVLWLLDQIEEVKTAPKNIEKFMDEKKYLDATQLITKVIGLLMHELVAIEALNDIRNELLSQKITMHEGFINELHHQLYFNTTKPIDNSNDPYPVLGVLIESLKQLGKIPDAVEAIKSQMDRYINMIVVNSSIEIADLSFGKEESDNPKRLLQLLETLFMRFRGVANAHNYILDHIKKIISKQGLSEVQLYEIYEVWSKIQSVLQLLLHDYLDADSIAATSQQMHGLGFSEITGSSFSSHFARKKVQRPRVAKLFRFEASSHAISMNTYLREQRAEKRINAGNTGEPHVLEHNATAQKVCKPSSRNIILIFGPLQLFIQEIEKAMHMSKNKKCSLHEYITDYIQNVFIRQSQHEMKKSFDAASKVTDPLKVLGHPTVDQDKSNSDKLIIQSALVVDQCVSELYTLMTNLEGYYDQFLAMVCSLLHEYKETLVQSYRTVVQPESEDQRITSATWIRDVEVNKVLRNLMNWQNVKNASNQAYKRHSKHKGYSQSLLADFSKEARFFTEKLHEEFIGKNSMVEDISDMAALANLHESLEWLTIRLEKFMSRIYNDAPEDTMNMLNQLNKEYQGMCDTCLLCLHIEVRVRCFYFLNPVFRNNNFDIRAMDSIENDPMVVKLSKDITDIDGVIRECLQPSKHKYVFEGLGHHIATVFINGTIYLKRISQTGIKKMSRNVFTLQQVLTHVTASRETHLDAARQFYEMLYNAPDDLQGIVVEQGVQFEEDDYVHAIELLHRSRPGCGSESMQKSRIQRLREIIREQALKSERLAEDDNDNW